MKVGDLVRIKPTNVSKDELDECFEFLKEEPCYNDWVIRSSGIKWSYSNIGTVLEYKELKNKYVWIKVMCPSGIGWMRIDDLEMVL